MAHKELLLFPGCSLEGSGSEYGLSMMAVLEALDRPVSVLDDWNCCGATAARSVDPSLSVRLSARNLQLAANLNADLLVNCAACYNNLACSRDYLEKHPEAWPDEGTDAPRPESTEIRHLLNLLTSGEMLQRFSHKITNRLSDMTLACYYGCLLVRPGGYTHVDDQEFPHRMDDLMAMCGANVVDWSYKTDCCGGSFSLTKKADSVELMAKIFTSALDRGATGIVTACPLCQANLDAWQGDVAKLMGRELAVPIYYFTELMALAMGLEGVEKWFKGHMIRPTTAARASK